MSVDTNYEVSHQLSKFVGIWKPFRMGSVGKHRWTFWRPQFNPGMPTMAIKQGIDTLPSAKGLRFWTRLVQIILTRFHSNLSTLGRNVLKTLKTFVKQNRPQVGTKPVLVQILTEAWGLVQREATCELVTCTNSRLTCRLGEGFFLYINRGQPKPTIWCRR